MVTSRSQTIRRRLGSVAFYGVATLSQSTLSPILGFIASIQRSKAAVSKALIVSDG